jgi:hypothetical protein
MALANFTDLKTAVELWLSGAARADLTAQVPDFITLYEADANRRIRIRQNMLTTPLSLAQGASSVALPAGFLEEIELNYNDRPESLTRAPFDTIDRYQTTDSAPGRPALYAITDSSVIFETEANQGYTINLRFYEKWDIAADTTNWLLTNAPDAYLFGSLAEAAQRTRDYELLTVAIQRRDAATDWVLRADSRTKSSTLMVDPALRAVGGFDIRYC